jgi:hypothetical protein
VAVAAAAVLMATAAAAAIPGTPLNDWIRARLGPAAGPAEVSPAAPSTGADAGASANELFVPLRDGALDVSIEAAGPGLSLRVRVVDEPELGVRAQGGAAGARYRSATGRLVIEGASNGEIVLSLPRSARAVRILVGGVPWIEQNDGGPLSVRRDRCQGCGSRLVVHRRLRPAAARRAPWSWSRSRSRSCSLPAPACSGAASGLCVRLTRDSSRIT